LVLLKDFKWKEGLNQKEGKKWKLNNSRPSLHSRKEIIPRKIRKQKKSHRKKNLNAGRGKPSFRFAKLPEGKDRRKFGWTEVRSRITLARMR